MKIHPVTILLFLAAPIWANDALDLLEGKKDAATIELPPLPEDTPVLSGAIGASADGVKPFKPMELTAFAKKSHELFDPLWSMANLYENQQNPYVQQLAITGLFEGSGAWGSVDNNSGTDPLDQSISQTVLRRAQLGARMKALYRTEVTGIVEMAGPARMNGIQNLSARTRITENTGVTVGKFRPLSTGENNTPDAELVITERSLLSNMIAPADSLGVMFDATRKGWTYQVGWFSGDFDDMIPRIKDDGLINVGVSRTQETRTTSGVPLRSRWFLNYLYNLNEGNSQTMPRHRILGDTQYQSIIATGFQVQMDRFGFLADFSHVNGADSAWGVTLTPTYWLLPGTLQLVSRYHFADTESAGGLFGGYGPSADPFFQGNGPIVSGDEFHSFYLGANFHLYENRMIISNGFEYSIFKDNLNTQSETKAVMWQTGAKLSF